MNRPVHATMFAQDPRHAAHVGDLGRDFGFRPAFFDFATATIHLARYRDGRPAPFHLLDGLPEEAVLVRAHCGRVVATKSSLVAGYERGGYFYTRSAAARAAAQWIPRPR